MAEIKSRVVAVAVAGAGLLALAGTMLPSQSSLNAIKKHEGVRHSAYLDAVGVPTICYGSTRKVFIGQRATPAECPPVPTEHTRTSTRPSWACSSRASPW